MKVKDLILYQVATDRNYKVGDKIYLKLAVKDMYFFDKDTEENLLYS